MDSAVSISGGPGWITEKAGIFSRYGQEQTRVDSAVIKLGELKRITVDQTGIYSLWTRVNQIDLVGSTVGGQNGSSRHMSPIEKETD